MRRVAAIAALAVLAAGCVTTPKRTEVVWPPPPETARIRFEQAFAQTSDLDTSGAAQVLRAVVGGDRDVHLGRPMGLALSPDGKRLYIADAGLPALLVADFEKQTVTQLAGAEVVGTAFGVAVDADERVYVVDQSGKRVVVLNRQGSVVANIGERAGLVRPSGAAIDRERKLLYVSDPATLRSPDHRVLVFTLDGQLVRTIGKGKGNGEAQFFFPVFLAVDAKGQLYVSDTMNFRVQVFSPQGDYVRSFGERGAGPGSFARLKGLAFDGFGNLYVVDGEYAVVQMFNRDFQMLMYFGGTAPKLEFLELPSGIAIDPKTNRIYVANEVHPRINVYQLINTKAEDAVVAPDAAAAE